MNCLKKILISFSLLLGIANAQEVKILTSGSNTSIRGMSVVDDNTIWVSGSNGTIGKSVNGGKDWNWMQVKSFEKTDFRDIEAFDETTAVIMGIDSPAYILRTADAGETWKVVFENKTKGMFLDGMEFWNEQSGIVVGDPVNNKFFIARTFDGGIHWRGIPEQNFPIADSGEACFAASGTNVRKLDKAEACFVSGGIRSRLFIRDQKTDIPFTKGKESAGANSVAVKNNTTLIVVGGNFLLKDSINNNCFITHDAGKTWKAPVISPHGYRSCIEYIEGNMWVCCGLNGVDLTTDNGNNWKWINKASFNVCRKAKDGKSLYFAGNDGKIAKLIIK